MADESMNPRRQPSRLQRRAPASIQVSPSSQWNVAIPLLSPLITSPENRNCIDNSNDEYRRVVNSDDNNNKIVKPEPEKTPIVCKKWQHPAAPFYYEPAPTLLQSICTGGTVDRS
ncbi:uncharacterized protein At4g14450, chloroplastic-like [Rutidosis leptorrhynchoides]|uniref:uncharacterized protein At4g14450, chloroplastic-like n=1 Tax=Rutidosis leptorrhynchoides TaxID=125765 RepID=UPI003A9949CF